MVYRWRYQDANGSDVQGPDTTWEDQVDAEDWLSGHWVALVESGIDRVTLLHGEAEIYGPMSLHAAE
ncbi:hypothetical protein D5S17_07210 [Pseudonocardiaceae bacterium YIM PH 21723]|nr:hypothetical protein D5S17_07210 [Pseudonocardiaceae bacterium YIM PH 21723]